jgi:hypothetical protein
VPVGGALTVSAALALAVLGCVVVHYEGLSILQLRLARLHVGPRRSRVLATIGGVLLMHLVEIALFALAFRLAVLHPDSGSIVGQHDGSVLDWLYFSAITYTTVGYGDVAPIGGLRLIAAIESLLGLVLIAWSASFTYLVMERYWDARRRAG